MCFVFPVCAEEICATGQGVQKQAKGDTQYFPTANSWNHLKYWLRNKLTCQKSGDGYKNDRDG